VAPHGHCYETAQVNGPPSMERDRKRLRKVTSLAFFCKVSSLRESRVLTASSSAKKGESPEPNASCEFSDRRQQAVRE
jgi:hypothetical protein